MSLEYRTGDVFDRLAEIPDGTIDLVVTSPPFLALRSYLPADHPLKAKEIGSEATPAAFIDTLLALTAEFGRVLAPHGSICVELGDTFSGSGGAGGDYNTDGLRDGAPKFDGSAARTRKRNDGGQYGNWPNGGTKHNLDERPVKGSIGWPLAKSLTGIPTLYPWSLAYGRNLLTGAESPAGLWRIRNIIVWARPNPPVGALGDKFRPATSYITVACRGVRRFFDLDAARTPHGPPGGSATPGLRKDTGSRNDDGSEHISNGHEAGAPPLDWHSDLQDGDWLWKLPTQPYKGAHYATFPLELPTRLITAMCPLRVCTVCGKPSERIVDVHQSTANGQPRDSQYSPTRGNGDGREANHRQGGESAKAVGQPSFVRHAETTGWTDCGCTVQTDRRSPTLGATCSGPGRAALLGTRSPEVEQASGDSPQRWRTGVVLDPFCGSGTTLEAAQNVGRHAIGIDLDPRNAELARSRVGMFMSVDEGVDA